MARVGEDRRCPAELRERAVRMVFVHEGDYPSQCKAIESIAEQLEVPPETLRTWVRLAETDTRFLPGSTADERNRMKLLEQENRELRRANEILTAVAIFFATACQRHETDPLSAPEKDFPLPS